MPNTKAIMFSSVAALLLTTPVLAVNTQFLLRDPIRYFTDEDWQIESDAAVKAAENNADGTSLAWENPTTGQSGTITPLRAYENNEGEQCRTIHFTNSYKEFTSAMTIEGCKNSSGEWYMSGATPRKTE